MSDLENISPDLREFIAKVVNESPTVPSAEALLEYVNMLSAQPLPPLEVQESRAVLQEIAEHGYYPKPSEQL